MTFDYEDENRKEVLKIMILEIKWVEIPTQAYLMVKKISKKVVDISKIL